MACLRAKILGRKWVRYSTAAAIYTLWVYGCALSQAPQTPAPPSNAAVAPGQPESAAPAAALPEPVAPSIREEEPAVYLLPDENDNYKPVINFRLEKFKQLLELEKQIQSGATRPSHAVEMSGEGVADESRVRLSLQFQVTTPDEGWVRVPIRLDEAILVSVRHEGPGEHVVVPSDDNRGYTAWFRGAGKDPHRLSISATVPVERAAGESRFRLSLPRLTTSELRLRVPLPDAQVRVPPGLELERLAANGDETLVRVLGAGNSIELSWRDSNSAANVAPAVLSTTGRLQVQMDGRAATTSATLTVTTAEGTISRFQVLLPPGAALITGSAQGYSVTAGSDNTGGSDRARIEVRSSGEPASQVILNLVTEQTLADPAAVQFIDLVGFDVLGARQQTGFLALRVVGDWQVVFGDRRNVREVPIGDLPSELHAKELLAGFEYLAQPSTLSARVVPRRPRVAVEPLYLYTVTTDSIELDARLRYTVRGARVFALELEFPDDAWEIAEVGPAGSVDLDGVLFEQVQPLSVPLLQPASGELELRVRARRSIPPGSKSVEFGLPRPLANTVAPASIVVLPANNVELLPHGDQVVGLARHANPIPIELPPHEQEPLAYRGDAGKARFVASHRVLKQVVAARVSSRIDLDDAAPKVEQRFRFTIAHEPLERISLACPRGLIGREGIVFAINGEPVQWIQDRDSDAAILDSQRIFLPLAKPHIGAVEVHVRYPISNQKLVPGVSMPLTVPLIVPADAAILHHEAAVVARPGLEARLRAGPWKITNHSRERSTRDARMLLTGAESANELALVLNLEDPEAFGATVAGRCWIQTSLGETSRRDRVVFRLDSRQPVVRMRLPESVIRSTVAIRVDGGQLSAQADTSGNYEIPLDNTAIPASEPAAIATDNHRPDTHVVEIEYDLPRPTGFDVRLTLPSFVDHARVNQTFWQVVLPKHQHIISRRGEYGSEFTWGWQGYYWGREPLMDAPALEKWVGASHSIPLANTANHYLCSTLGQPGEMTLRIVPRWLLVLAASGAALISGLGVIYLPALRHPALIWVAAIATLAIGFVAPEPTLIVLQAAVLGLLLTVVAGVLKRLLSRRQVRHPGSSLLQPGSSVLRRVESDAFAHPVAAGSNSSTDSGPLAEQVLGPESKS